MIINSLNFDLVPSKGLGLAMLISLTGYTMAPCIGCRGGSGRGFEGGMGDRCRRIGLMIADADGSGVSSGGTDPCGVSRLMKDNICVRASTSLESASGRS